MASFKCFVRGSFLLSRWFPIEQRYCELSQSAYPTPSTYNAISISVSVSRSHFGSTTSGTELLESSQRPEPAACGAATSGGVDTNIAAD